MADTLAAPLHLSHQPRSISPYLNLYAVMSSSQPQKWTQQPNFSFRNPTLANCKFKIFPSPYGFRKPLRNTASPKTYITAATTPRDAIDFRDRPHQIERCEISRKEDRNTGERWRSCATTWCPVRIFTSRRHRIQGSREEITQVISSIASRVDVGLGFNRPNVYLVPTSYQNTVLMQV
jgi:hypothetical protein